MNSSTLSTNKRVWNLAVSKKPWDLSEVIRDKHKISKNIPRLGPQKMYCSHVSSAAEMACLSRMTCSWRMRKWNTELAYCGNWDWLDLTRNYPQLDLRFGLFNFSYTLQYLEFTLHTLVVAAILGKPWARFQVVDILTLVISDCNLLILIKYLRRHVIIIYGQSSVDFCTTLPRRPAGYNNSIPIRHIKAVLVPLWCAELECYC